MTSSCRQGRYFASGWTRRSRSNADHRFVYRVGMRNFLLAGTIASLSSLIAAPPAVPEPCTAATAACTEWVSLGGGPLRSLIYRSHSLDTRNESIRRALIMVHGTNRNADHYFTTATTAA